MRGDDDLDGGLGKFSPQQTLQFAAGVVPDRGRPRGQPKGRGEPLAVDFEAMNLVELPDASPGFGVLELGQCGPDRDFPLSP